eukprot:Sdes_comp20491_c0_seq1m14918
MSIEIPISGSSYEVLEIEFDNLPNHVELIDILRQENAHPEIYFTLAIQYYKQVKYSAFEDILVEATQSSISQHFQSESGRKEAISILNALAAYYVHHGSKEKNKRARDEYFDKATSQYNRADQIDILEKSTWLGKGFMMLHKGDFDRANDQFDYVLEQNRDNIPAILGKACINFHKQNYSSSLNLYKKALRLKPDCPANVRLGIGLCLFHLGHIEKARFAFERVLQLEP